LLDKFNGALSRHLMFKLGFVDGLCLGLSVVGLQVRLVDVCLRSDVVVYEPIWAAIPANKAILAVLWQLFPGHKYLLETSLDLTPELRESGYVVKPINGRCGHNIKLVAKGDVIAAQDGKFSHANVVYQRLCQLPTFVDNSEHVQVSTFVMGGHYAGTVLRVDSSPIIKYGSDVMALRIVDDHSGTVLDDGHVEPADALQALHDNPDISELQRLHHNGDCPKHSSCQCHSRAMRADVCVQVCVCVCVCFPTSLSASLYMCAYVWSSVRVHDCAHTCTKERDGKSGRRPATKHHQS
jgi:hypothetical protein